MFNRENAPVPIIQCGTQPTKRRGHISWRTSRYPMAIDCNFMLLCFHLIIFLIQFFCLAGFFGKSFTRKMKDEMGNLRTVHLMELRTLKKLGFNAADINLAKWRELAESDKVTFLMEKVDTMLSNTTRIYWQWLYEAISNICTVPHCIIRNACYLNWKPWIY